MRVISQDGTLNIPYDTIILRQCGGNIHALTSIGEGCTNIAYYSTEDRAFKAMKDCYKCGVLKADKYQFETDEYYKQLELDELNNGKTDGKAV